MSQPFTGRCSACGAWGHMAADHQNNQIGRTEPVASEAQGRIATYSFPHGHEVGDPFGSILTAPFTFHNNYLQQEANLFPSQSQSEPQGQEQPVPRAFDAIHEITAGKNHFVLSYNPSAATIPGILENIVNPSVIFMTPEVAREIENCLAHASDSARARQGIRDILRDAQLVDISSVRALGGSDGRMPVESLEHVRPQGQHRWSLLHESHTAQPTRPGAALLGIGSMSTQDQENISRGLGDAGSMAPEQRDIDNNAAEASRPDSQGGPLNGDGSSRADRRERDSSTHWSESQYEVKPGEIVGLNLESRDLESLNDLMARELPPGALVNIELVPVSAEDSTASGPVIKGSLSRFFGR